MDWIKRNLFFVIGAAVALVLMVGAGFYTWTGIKHNSEAQEELDKKYAELKRLTDLKPNPGGGKVDNVKIAQEQQKQAKKVYTDAATRFQRIPAIPPETNVTAEAFAASLATTIHHLQLDATNAGVVLAPRYSFSFEQQSKAVRFTGSIDPLAVQLGEVSEIVRILIAAKINSLDSIQRERVTPDDSAGVATDYIDQHSETNELGILSPYQVTLRCFTPELAQLLCGFGNNANGIVLKSVNVEPATAVAGYEPAIQAVTPVYTPQPQPQLPITRPGGGESRQFMERYGIGRRGAPAPQPAYVPPVTTVAPVATGPRTVLDEKQLKVTLLVQVVKLSTKN